MKPIICKMRTYFFIQGSKNVRNITKRIKKVLGAKYVKANFNKIFIHSNYLKTEEQFFIFKPSRT